jgi:carboxyl-terminal processing protease
VLQCFFDMKRASFSYFRTIIVIIATALVAGSIGYNMGRQQRSFTLDTGNGPLSLIQSSPGNPEVDMSLFWEVWHRLESGYVDKAKIDRQKMVYGAISGMTSSIGDPYTVFLPPEANQDAKDNLNGVFEGIGAQLGIVDKQIVVVAPLKGMPAEKAGILSGDIIYKVNGEETISWSVPQAVEKIRGPKGSQVKLDVIHEGAKEPISIEVTRDTIQVPSVESEFKDNVAILKLYQFGDNTNREWEQEVAKIVDRCGASGNSSCKGLVFDLRNNPGGYLQGSVFVASEFLKDGLVVTQEHASGSKEEYTVKRVGVLRSIPMVVLINKGSASASEIVAGALKVRGRAKLVGEKSFGKGSVQEAQDLPGGAGLHVTTAKWLLPDGTWINGAGVMPDVEVADNNETPDIDEQLEKAIEQLQ